MTDILYSATKQRHKRYRKKEPKIKNKLFEEFKLEYDFGESPSSRNVTTQIHEVPPESHRPSSSLSNNNPPPPLSSIHSLNKPTPLNTRNHSLSTKHTSLSNSITWNDIEDNTTAPQETSTTKTTSTDSHETHEDRYKQVFNLTSLLLDSRNILRTDFNVIDLHDMVNHNMHREPIKMSTATKHRAELVKSTLGLKYLIIERLHDQISGDVPSTHPGVEGVYNPLQNIRNRKVRNKFHEQPKPLSQRTVPLAVNVFSSRNLRLKDPKKMWSTPWAVELYEIVGDIQWVHSHWHDLLKPDGSLWFPPDSRSPSPEPKRKGRLQDLLFNSDEDMGKSPSHSNIDLTSKHHSSLLSGEQAQRGRQKSTSRPSTRTSTRHSLVGVSDKDDLGGYHISSIRNPKSPRRKRLKESFRLKQHLNHNNISSEETDEKHYGAVLKERLFKKIDRNYSENEETGDEIESSRRNDLDDKVDMNQIEEIEPREEVGRTGKVRKGEKIDKSEKNDASSEVLEVSDYSNDDISPSQLIIAPNSAQLSEVGDDELDRVENEDDDDVQDYLPDINDLSIHPLKSSSESVIMTEIKDGTVEEKEPIVKIDNDVEELNSIVPNMKYLHSLLNIREHYVLSVLPLLLERRGKRISDLINEDIAHLTNKTIKVQNEMIPQYQAVYGESLKDINALIHDVNDSFAVRVDHLLSTSDRLIGEINISLALEVRKLGERIDKLTGSSVNFTRSPNQIKDGGNKIIYSLLENAIVILLRTIWIVVNIYKAFRFLLLILWRFVRFFI